MIHNFYSRLVINLFSNNIATIPASHDVILVQLRKRKKIKILIKMNNSKTNNETYLLTSINYTAT